MSCSAFLIPQLLVPLVLSFFRVFAFALVSCFESSASGFRRRARRGWPWSPSNPLHQTTFHSSWSLSALFAKRRIVRSLPQARGLQLIIEQSHVGRIFVARESGHIVGMVNLLFTVSPAEGGLVVLLAVLVVRPGHRGKGTGSALLRHAIDFAGANGFTRITLLTDRVNEDAMRFYAKHGFQLSAMVPMRLVFSAHPQLGRGLR
jgi:GNAT superfamily N-acetyltransferase